jgi:hypothetical protein
MPAKTTLAQFATVFVPTILIHLPASADLIGPGDLTEDLATSLDQRPDLGGDLEARQMIPYTLKDEMGDSIYLGQIVHDVLRDPKDQTLSFAYHFMNTSTAILGVQDVMAGEFAGFQTDVAVLTDSTGETAPVDAIRTTDGKDVVFDFDAVASRIAPGATSYTFLVKTNATQFDNNGAMSISAFTADSTEEGSAILSLGDTTIKTFRPSGEPVLGSVPPPPTSVPLPPPVWTAIPTMIGSAIYVRRLRRRQGRG